MTFGAHGLSRTITLKFYQMMQNVIVISIQEKNRQFKLAAIQKAKNCHFSRIPELTQTIKIIHQNEALGISFSEKLISRSFEVTQGKKSRVKFDIKLEIFENDRTTGKTDFFHETDPKHMLKRI